jgi:hypothetical protein
VCSSDLAKNLGVHPGLIEELFQVVHKYSVQKQIEVRKDRTPEADSERS